MLMAATAYNLKKYLKFIEKKAESKAEEVRVSLIPFFVLIKGQKRTFKALYF